MNSLPGPQVLGISPPTTPFSFSHPGLCPVLRLHAISLLIPQTHWVPCPEPFLSHPATLPILFFSFRSVFKWNLEAPPGAQCSLYDLSYLSTHLPSLVHHSCIPVPRLPPLLLCWVLDRGNAQWHTEITYMLKVWRKNRLLIAGLRLRAGHLTCFDLHKWGRQSSPSALCEIITGNE